MNEVTAPWAAWYGSEPLKMEFSENWELAVHHMKGGSDISDSGIRQAFADAIEAPPLREFARGKSTAAILRSLSPDSIIPASPLSD